MSQKNTNDAEDSDQGNPSNIPPIIKTVLNYGNTVDVYWSPTSDKLVVGYEIRVSWVAGGNVVAAAYVDGLNAGSGSVDLGGNTLVVGAGYAVTVVGQWRNYKDADPSAPVPLQAALPEIASAYYDGIDLVMRWNPYLFSSAGYIVAYMKEGQTLVDATTYTIHDPAATSARFPATLDTSSQWQVLVEANCGGNMFSISSLASLPKPVTPMMVTGIEYRPGTGVTASWRPLMGIGVESYRVSLLLPENGQTFSVDVAGGASYTGIVPLREPLAPNSTPLLIVAGLTADGVGGILSLAFPVIADTPELQAITFDGASNKEVNFSWSPQSNPLITGYTLCIAPAENSSKVSFTASVPQGTFSGKITLDNPLDGSKSWVGWVTATGASGTVPASSVPVALPAASPAITSISCDGENITVNWSPGAFSALPGFRGFTVGLLSGATSIATVATGKSSATIPVPAGAPDGLTVQVAANAGCVTGAWTNALNVLVKAPSMTKALTDPFTALATLTWSTVAGATGYRVRIGDAVYSSTTNSLDLQEKLSADAAIAATITATILENNCSITGPASAQYPLPTGVPELTDLSCDGVSITASWTPVPNASAYRILLTQGTTLTDSNQVPATNGTSDVSVALPTALDATKTYSVKVQACFPDGSSFTGPGSDSLPLFSPGFFLSTAKASTAYPYSYPATMLSTVSATTLVGETIALYVPQIATAGSLTGLPFTKGAFTLAANTAPAAYPYKLTIASGGDAWSFGATPVRTALQKSYLEFLLAVEKAGAAPWGVLMLQEAIARILPSTFQESLYYAYGMNFSSEYYDPIPALIPGSVDLRPGMILRVAADVYRTVPGTQQPILDNGYSAMAFQDYEIGSHQDSNGFRIGFGAFITELVANNCLSVTPPYSPGGNLVSGVADGADLYYPGFAGGPFFRLFVPSALPPANDLVSTESPDNFCIASASTFDVLTMTTNAVQNLNVPPAVFRGRSVVRVCIRVSLDGASVVVPVGTTVRNLLEGAGRTPAIAPAHLNGLRLERALGPVVTDPNAPLNVASSYPVRFDWKTSGAYGAGWNGLSLPLLPGDRVSTQG